jgi:hypothetical protein
MTDNWLIVVDPEVLWATAYLDDEPMVYGSPDDVFEHVLTCLGVDIVDGNAVVQDGPGPACGLVVVPSD